MTHHDIAIQTALLSWTNTIASLRKSLAAISDEGLQKDVLPGRNRAYYLYGHLTAVHDRLFPLLVLGGRLHPELDLPFVDKADKTIPDQLSAGTLRQVFEEVHDHLATAIATLPSEDWLKKHATISDADFLKEPLRNRLAVLLSRTGHAMYHAGQIRLAQS